MDMHAWQQLPGATRLRITQFGARATANHSQEPLQLG